MTGKFPSSQGLTYTHGLFVFLLVNLHNKKMVHLLVVPQVYPFIVILIIIFMKVAIIQFRASTNKEINLKKIIMYISKASSENAVLCAFQNL